MNEIYALIDVDGVIADLLTVWLNKYNKKYDDNLSYNDIIDWDLMQFVKPECGKNIFTFLDNPRMYKYVKPIPLALEGINDLRNYMRIVYTTATPYKVGGIKYWWLSENGFWNEKDYYIETHSKFLINGDLLIDDGFHNVQKFPKLSLLFDQPWNQKYHHPRRIHGWEEILDNMNKFREWKKNEENIFN